MAWSKTSLRRAEKRGLLEVFQRQKIGFKKK
jgi:hypothetical protein